MSELTAELQAEAQKLGSGLTADEFETLNKWGLSQKRLITDESNEGVENVVNIVTWLRDRKMPITSQGLGLALSNIQNSSRRPLHWTAEPVPEKFGRHTGKTFASDREDKSREWVNGRRNWAKVDNPALRGEIPKSVQEADWKARAEAVQGSRHSETASIQRMFIQKSDGSGIDWLATWRARERAAEGQR